MCFGSVHVWTVLHRLTWWPYLEHHNMQGTSGLHSGHIFVQSLYATTGKNTTKHGINLHRQNTTSHLLIIQLLNHCSALITSTCGSHISCSWTKTQVLVIRWKVWHKTWKKLACLVFLYSDLITFLFTYLMICLYGLLHRRIFYASCGHLTYRSPSAPISLVRGSEGQQQALKYMDNKAWTLRVMGRVM